MQYVVLECLRVIHTKLRGQRRRRRLDILQISTRSDEASRNDSQRTEHKAGDCRSAVPVRQIRMKFGKCASTTSVQNLIKFHGNLACRFEMASRYTANPLSAVSEIIFLARSIGYSGRTAYQISTKFGTSASSASGRNTTKFIPNLMYRFGMASDLRQTRRSRFRTQFGLRVCRRLRAPFNSVAQLKRHQICVKFVRNASFTSRKTLDTYQISSESNARFLNGVQYGKRAVRGFWLNFLIALNGIQRTSVHQILRFR